jgi:NAD/NADP transhydrogenase alpha subunit
MAETAADKAAREAKEEADKAAKNIDKAGYVVAPLKRTDEKHGQRTHTGGNLMIMAGAKVDPDTFDANEKKGIMYFPGEAIPNTIKPTLIKKWVAQGNIITKAEYDKFLEMKAKEEAAKKAEETKRR